LLRSKEEFYKHAHKEYNGMKKKVVTVIVSIAIGLGAGWLIFRPVTDGGKPGERKILYYRDPMNPQNTSLTPKKAPDGMDFVPVYAEGSAGSGERKIAYYQDPMHPWFTSDKPGKAPDCGMDLVPVYEGESDAKGIKIDPVTVQNIGVKVEDVTTRKLTKVIRTVGKVQADETKIYSINTKIMGWVENLQVDYTGKRVRMGEPLLELYSPELVSTQEEYLQAIRYQKKLEESSIGEARQGAENLVESARRRLLYWDIPESEIQALERRGTPKKTMTFYSPVNGYVMDKMVFKGQSVMAGMELYKIADLSTVWIIADIYQYELPWVKVGQKVDIELSYLPGKQFQGTVTYIYPMLSMETKTAKVRVEVRNTPMLEFKPEMFANVQIASPVALNSVAVPEQAIIRSGERNVAVIALGGGYFDPRDVKLGVSAGGYVQILDGVKEGEKIVVSSQFLIDSESNLKAAISQMQGHAGHDMSPPASAVPPGQAGKPMEEPTSDDDQHKGHEMKEMPAKKKPDAHEGHEMKNDNAGLGVMGVQKVVDPVCGMEISPDEELSHAYKDKKYYFCSEDDLMTFKKDPDKHAK
jgi:membrane fusion protein, copper/silver efflux system